MERPVESPTTNTCTGKNHEQNLRNRQKIISNFDKNILILRKLVNIFGLFLPNFPMTFVSVGKYLKIKQLK